MKSRMMYIENKVTGEAHIGMVTFSRTFRTVYYKDKEFARISKGGITGNHYDVKTNEEYWISGPKKRGGDRLYDPINLIVDEDAKEEYEALRGRKQCIRPHLVL